MGDHLIVLHSAVRACAGYSRHDAPSILLDGSSVARDTEHGRAVTAQLTRRHGTLEEAIDAAGYALGAAGLSKSIRRQARAASEDYFYGRLDLTPSHELGGRAEIVESLELMPEPMYRALEDVVGLVVDGEYEELRVASGHRLEVEDLRRRVEDDCPESLVLAPREIYRVEAVTRSDDPELPGWAYFLDLWTETGPARLHIEGELEESGERFTATLKRHPALICGCPARFRIGESVIDGLDAVVLRKALRNKRGRLRPLTRKAHPWVDSRPSEDQAAFAARGRSDEGLALGLPSLSDLTSVAHPPPSSDSVATPHVPESPIAHERPQRRQEMLPSVLVGPAGDR